MMPSKTPPRTTARKSAGTETRPLASTPLLVVERNTSDRLPGPISPGIVPHDPHMVNDGITWVNVGNNDKGGIFVVFRTCLSAQRRARSETTRTHQEQVVNIHRLNQLMKMKNVKLVGRTLSAHTLNRWIARQTRTCPTRRQQRASRRGRTPTNPRVKSVPIRYK